MDAKYLHPWLIAIFLLLFALMSLVGCFRLAKEGKKFGAAVLVICFLIFGYSTWIAATLQT